MREKSSFARYLSEAEKKKSFSPSTDVSANVIVKESENDDKVVEENLERGDVDALAEHLAERRGRFLGRRRDNERCCVCCCVCVGGVVWYKSDFWIAFGVSRSSWPRIGIAVDGGLQDTSHRL